MKKIVRVHFGKEIQQQHTVLVEVEVTKPETRNETAHRAVEQAQTYLNLGERVFSASLVE